mmetsp:Transcript_28647/g.93590  ORF Transcript_28647/g.93590 Transcript_28647/m.93590 type:complete len:318 (+) Transcript_28647:48-1001(+)
MVGFMRGFGEVVPREGVQERRAEREDVFVDGEAGAVVGLEVVRFGGAHPHESARHFLTEEAEVLAAHHHWRLKYVEPERSPDRARAIRLTGVVHHRRIRHVFPYVSKRSLLFTLGEGDVGGAPVGEGSGHGPFSDGGDESLKGGQGERADGSGEPRGVRDDVEDVARLEDGDGDDPRVRGVRGARDDRLECGDDGGAGDDRVARLVRRGAVPTGADDEDVERARGRHRRPRAHAHAARGPDVVHVAPARRHVQPERCARGPERALVEHPQRTCAAFFRGLEDEPHFARQLRLVRLEHPRRPEQHRHVRVVPARVHLA